MSAGPKALQGSLSLLSENRAAFAADQLRLLEAIGECGSISAAARKVGISYKTAWDRIDAINNMSDQPLVRRSVGGSRGGGTALTDHGRRIVQGFRALEQEHEFFLSRLQSTVHSLSDVAHFMRIGSMQTTARNQFRGIIKGITPGAVNTTIEVAISDHRSLTVMITEDSCARLKLRPGMAVVALIKASAVLISKDPDPMVSACNRLLGTIMEIAPGAVNSDLVIDLGAGKTISAIVTNASVRDLALVVGQEVCALFKASSVILAIE